MSAVHETKGVQCGSTGEERGADDISKELNREDRINKKTKTGASSSNRLPAFKKRDNELAAARKKRDREE